MGRRIERISEDWLAVAIGLAVFALSLSTVAGLDLLGWAAAPTTWIGIDKAVQPAGPSPPATSLLSFLRTALFWR